MTNSAGICHIEKLTKKIASGIGAMKLVRHLIPPATLHLIHQAFIQPHFDYCSTVWGTCGVTLQDKLQKLQNRAAHVLTFSNYDVNFLYKALHRIIDIDVEPYVDFYKETDHYSFRHKDKPDMPERMFLNIVIFIEL